jgi:fructose/tagatose bisphosphate aldolase
LIDKSYLSLEENIEATNKVVEYTRAKNVAVEAELGLKIRKASSTLWTLCSPLKML